MHLTIAYITARRNPRIEWFFDSLMQQHGILDGDPIRVLVIDSHMTNDARQIEFLMKMGKVSSIKHSAPKPCVWQGPHRLVSEDHFDASNARNTALCYAPDGWICFVDDLSVLMPGWLDAVREAMASNKIVCGSYRKVKNLKVENGVAKSWDETESGMDTRARFAKGNPWPCDGGWLYGCSCAMPVEALLTINGWPEDLCGGHGGEDCLCGIVLQNAGYQFIYDQRMLTLESEEAHHEEPALRKDDWHFENGVAVRGGDGKSDKSHAALNIALQSKHFPNHTNFRELRQHILNGGSFPIDQSPQHDWYSKIALKDL